MDTVIIHIENPHLPSAIHRNVGKMGYREGRYYGKTRDPQRSPHGYKQAFWGYADGKHFYVAYDPYNPRKVYTVLTVHLSQFENFAEVMTWLSRMCGRYTTDVIGAELYRLDMCVDIAVPFETIQQCLTQPKVSENRVYRSRTGRSLTLASKPRFTMAYEKKVEKNTVDWVPDSVSPKVSKYNYVSCVRIEVRTWKHRRPIKCLSEVPKLIHVNPFEHLELARIDEALLADVSPKKRHLINDYRWHCEHFGAQEAKKIFSQNGRFKDRIGHYLRPLDLNLRAAWMNRINRYL